MADSYTLGLFANMYPAFKGDFRGNFIRQMVCDLEERGVQVKKAVKTSPSVTGYIPFSIQSLKLARDTGADVYQAEYIPHSSMIPALIGRRNVPLVLKFHGDDARIFPFRNAFTRSLTRSMLRRADHVITASAEMKQLLVTVGGDPSKISPIHTGVDTEFFVPGSRETARNALGLPQEKTIVFFVGRLHPLKGVPELVKVAQVCPDILFVLGGPGTVPEHPANCQFPGVIDHSAIRTWFQAADCYILPTHTEAIPTSVMEAFSCGIPAVTTDVGGCPEIVEDGISGKMVSVGNVPALKDAVLWMQDNPKERLEMGKKARATAINRFDHRILIEQLMSVHKSLLGRL